MVKKQTNTILSFKDWKSLICKSFIVCSQVWWRIGIITILVFIMSAVGALIFGFLEYVLLGGVENLQDVMANIKMGGHITLFESLVVWGVFALGFFWIIFSIVLGKLGNLIVMKIYVDNKKEENVSPYSIFFTKGWGFIYRYIMLFLRMVWYSCWAALLEAVVYAGVISFFAEEAFFTVFGLLIFSILFFFSGDFGIGIEEITSQFQLLVSQVPDAFNTFFVVLGIFLFGFTVYRGFRTALVQQTLVHFNNNSISKTFNTALKMVDGAWWQLFLSIFAYFFLINVVRVLFLLPEIMMKYDLIELSETLFDLFQAIDLLFSLFILMPLMICFMYLLMLHFSQTKKLKP